MKTERKILNTACPIKRRASYDPQTEGDKDASDYLMWGLATRLGDATKKVPKVLLDIAGKTVLEWQIQLLKDVGVEEVILASGHLHNVLYERVGHHYADVRVQYAKRGEATRHRRRDSECDAMYHHISFFCSEWGCVAF